MTVEDCYVDSSALRQLYAHDRHSPQMAAWRFKNPGALGVTRFTRAELVNSMAAAVHRRDIARKSGRTFRTIWRLISPATGCDWWTCRGGQCWTARQN
jgi:hypothetical protein